MSKSKSRNFVVFPVITFRLFEVAVGNQNCINTFHHSYAICLLKAGYDILTIKELIDHSDIRTTMKYTDTIKSLTAKRVLSLLDFNILTLIEHNNNTVQITYLR